MIKVEGNVVLSIVKVNFLSSLETVKAILIGTDGASTLSFEQCGFFGGSTIATKNSFIKSNGGDVSLSGCTFNNSAVSNNAVMHYEPPYYPSSSFNITNMTINNITSQGENAAVFSTTSSYSYYYTKITFKNITVDNSGSSTATSGGIFAIVSDINFEVDFEMCILKHITLGGVTNGALSISGGVKEIFIVDSSFSNIATGNMGGAIFLDISSINNYKQIRSCLFSICSAKQGGAIYIKNNVINLTYCKFHANTGVVNQSDVFYDHPVSDSDYTGLH
jgi:hypothetical protein